MGVSSFELSLAQLAIKLLCLVLDNRGDLEILGMETRLKEDRETVSFGE